MCTNILLKGNGDMVAKLWKKVLLVIVIIACLYNVVAKLATKISFKEQMEAITDYAKTLDITNKTEGESRK